MGAFSTGLRALKHPGSLLCIAVLLLNDHVLKTSMPSFLTGKLSDFAGLYFFPFLLAAALGLVLDRWRVSPHRTGALAFFVTLAWFGLIKTWPAANNATTAALAWLLGRPVQIVLDPTDLAALAVLWPAWSLWVRLSQQALEPRWKPAYLVLGLATLSALATAPCPPEARVTSLAVHAGMIYVGRLYEVEGMQPVAARSQDGLVWEAVQEADRLPEEVPGQFQEPVELPVVVCETANPQVCYRIAGPDQVEGSQDAGSTWEVVWRLPSGRRQFMERYLDSFLIGCKAEVDAGPYDLALLPSGNGAILVAAMGNEGVLVRGQDGAWQRVPVLYARPTPTRGLAPGVPFNWFFILFGETVRLFFLAMLAWAGLTVGGVQFCLKRLETRSPGSVAWAIRPVWIGLALSIVIGFGLLLVLAWMRLAYAELVVPILLMATGIGLWPVPFLAWRRAASLAIQPAPVLVARGASIVAALGVFPIAWLPFAGWVFGMPPFYAVALILAAAIGFASLGIGIRKILHCGVTAGEFNKRGDFDGTTHL